MFQRRCLPNAFEVTLLGILLVMPAYILASPPSEGLVLWLDADNEDSLAIDEDGRVRRWSDRSGEGNDAVQDGAESRPRWESHALGDRPVVHFDGKRFLSMGRPESLDFTPGSPFTIAIVCQVKDKGRGTFLAKGGGAASGRAYQLYAAPGRLGSVTYGVMRENREQAGSKIAIEVCDGKQVKVLSNGEDSLAFAAAKGASRVDVLIGARRKDADNTGTAYPLFGDIAEIVVYDRALPLEELNQLGAYFERKYALDSRTIEPMTARRLVDKLKKLEPTARLDGFVADLVRLANEELPEFREVLVEDSASASALAELLVHTAQSNQLTSPLASLAGEMLCHEDPFVRGMAEWSISMKVGGENNGQESVWPTTDVPDWYVAWLGLNSTERLEADWVRQAVSTGVHRSIARLAASVDAMIDRVTRMQQGYRDHGAPDETLGLLEKRLARLNEIHRKIALQGGQPGSDVTTARRLWIDARRVLRGVVLSNPALDFDRIVCVKQFAPHTVRNITRSYSWKHKPGGDIAVLSGIKSGVQVKNVIQGQLGPGYVWGLDLWWDADRVVFGYARQPSWPPAVDTANFTAEGRNVFTLRQQHEPMHLYEIAVDGSGLKQITDDPYWSDFEPTYCATGEIVFASDRCGRSAECGNDTYDHTNPNLYIASPDGSNVRKWTDSKDIDRYPHSLDDGRIAYTHWEYQERHFMEVHALWTARADGTMSDALFKHHMPAPCGLRDTRSIPGTSKLISIATGHHTFAYGPVVIVDPACGNEQ